MTSYKISNIVEPNKSFSDNEKAKKYPYYLSIRLLRKNNGLATGGGMYNTIKNQTLLGDMPSVYKALYEGVYGSKKATATPEEVLEMVENAYSLGRLIAYEYLQGISYIKNCIDKDDEFEERFIRSHIRQSNSRFHEHVLMNGSRTVELQGKMIGGVFSKRPMVNIFTKSLFGNSNDSTADMTIETEGRNSERERQSFGSPVKYLRTDIDKIIHNTFIALTNFKTNSLCGETLKLVAKRTDTDIQYFTNIHHAIINDDFDSFKMLVKDNLTPSFSNDRRNTLKDMNADYSLVMNKQLAMDVGSLYRDGIIQVLGDLGDNVLFLPTKTKNMRIPPFSSVYERDEDSNLVHIQNGKQFSYINGEDVKNKTFSVVDAVTIMFKTKEDIEYFVENTRNIVIRNGASGVIPNTCYSVATVPIFKFIKHDAVGSISEKSNSTKVNVHKSTRKTFFDPKTLKTVLELKVPLPSFVVSKQSVDSVGDSTIYSDGDIIAIRHAIKTAAENDTLGIKAVIEAMWDNEYGVDYNINLNMLDTDLGEYAINKLEHYKEISPDIALHVANHDKLKYQTDSLIKKRVVMEGVPEYWKTHTLSIDELTEKIYEDIADYIINVAPYAFNNQRRNHRALRWVRTNFRSGYVVIPSITLSYGQNTTEGEYAALKRYLKKSKVLQHRNVKVCNIYPYITKDEHLDELLDIIKYI